MIIVNFVLLVITPLITRVISTNAPMGPLKVFVAESGSLVRLRCDLPKDFWQHSSPSNDIIWKKKSPKDLIFHNNDSNGNTKAPKWKTAPYNNAASSASSAGQDIKQQQQQKQSLAPFSTSTADSTEMEIKSAKASDSGLWACMSQKDEEIGEQILDHGRLLVIPRFASGPFLFTENGNILSNSSVITASEGEALQLICVARQPQDLQFDLNGREIRGHKVLTYLMGPQTQLQTSVAYKVLNKTAEKSFQNVSCGSTLVKIEVHYGPSFTIKREPQFGIPILQGMTVMLGCDVDANPVINATGWLKNEKQLPAVGNPVLVLHDVDIKDVGWYQCTTTYYGETISSIGYFLNIHPVENEFLNEEHDSNEEQTDVASVLQQQKMEGQEKKVEGDGGGGSGSLLWPQPASEDKSSSSDELQKSIQLATNVLDLPEEDGRCSGCCNYPKQDYGHPKIDLVNGTLKVMRLKRPNVMNLTVRICANPPVDRIIWELPTSELLKPGQRSSESRQGLVLHSWPTNATCSDVKLFAQNRLIQETKTFLAGTHWILAKNRLGYDETTILVEIEENSSANLDDPVNSATFQQTSAAQCDSVHFQSFFSSLILMFIWTCHFCWS